MTGSFESWGWWAGLGGGAFFVAAAVRWFFPNRLLLLDRWKMFFRGLPIGIGAGAGVPMWAGDIGGMKAVIYGGAAGFFGGALILAGELILKRVPEIASNAFFKHFGFVAPAPASEAGVAMVDEAVQKAAEVATVLTAPPPPAVLADDAKALADKAVVVAEVAVALQEKAEEAVAPPVPLANTKRPLPRSHKKKEKP